MPDQVATRRRICADLETLGLERGDAVLAHAALRMVGPILGGPDTLIDALLDVIGPEGTLLGYCDWQMPEEIQTRPDLRDEVPPFDPASSRSMRENGSFPELLRTRPGTLRSANPGASCTAIGGRAAWFVADHPLDYGYGPDSPFGKLVATGGKTLLIGAPRDTMTLLHHAEQMADIPNKRVVRFEAPILVDGKKVWRWFEEYDTANPPEGLPEDYFKTIVTEFLDSGRGRTGSIGHAPSVLVRADEIVPFAVDWLESRFKATR